MANSMFLSERLPDHLRARAALRELAERAFSYALFSSDDIEWKRRRGDFTSMTVRPGAYIELQAPNVREALTHLRSEDLILDIPVDGVQRSNRRRKALKIPGSCPDRQG